MSDISNRNPNSAATSLRPSDTEESNKLAEENQIKQQNLTDLGAQFKQAREALGYNISDLNEHTGLSTIELEAVEQGSFQHVEQQDYVEYYIHTYAALLSLDADQVLATFRQNYHEPEATSTGDEQDIYQIDDVDIDIHDEDQYEDAFTDEARKTLEALDASGIDSLKANDQPEDEQDADLANHVEPTPTQEITGIQPLTIHEPITSNPKSKPFPWLKLILSIILVLVAAGGAYYANLKYGSGQTLNQISNQITESVTSSSDDKPNNDTSAISVSTDANANNDSNISIVKDTDRVPEGQKAKKIGTLDSKIITQGSDDLNAPTAVMVQKPLVLISQPEVGTSGQTTENIGDLITDTGENSAAENAIAPTDAISQTINDDLVETANIAAAEEAAKQTSAGDLQVPVDPIQQALAQLPTDNEKFSLHASENSWILIEDDAAQILFSGELTPEKIFTFPKIVGVIISLADAGVLDVYKGKQLLGKLGVKDETLDLVSVEQRFNQFSN
ncbi:MAG: helix-turn-helix domain-containing protein [Alphaproteobacteria bacterium]|nr:helix-turn-helix domain-containing protein [Alphaproteobacteria bacterium]